MDDHSAPIPNKEGTSKLGGSIYIVQCAQLRATLATPLNNMWGEEEKTGLAILCARATCGRGLPSFDARTMGTHQAASSTQGSAAQLKRYLAFLTPTTPFRSVDLSSL